VFGNEHRKVVIEDVNDKQGEKWGQFMCQQAAHKVVSKAMGARTVAMPGA